MSEKTKLHAITNPYRAADAIANWLKAYPESVFPELSKEEWEKIHETLTEAGLSGERFGASNMRHVLNALREYLEPILEMVKSIEEEME